MNLVNQLEEHAQRQPDRIALIEDGRQISYEELYAQVCAGADFLRHCGFRKGDCILILQPISIDLYISLLAVFHAGMTVMFIDPSAAKAVIRNSLRLRRPEGCIAVAKAHLLRLSIPEIRRIKCFIHTSGWVPLSKKWQPRASEKERPINVQKDHPALITFTSGSTGMPKAACRSHGFLLAQHQALAESLAFKEGEVDLITLPIFAIANLASGMTSVIANTDLRYPIRADSEAISKQCREHKVTRCAASPAFFQKLLCDGLFPPFDTIYTGGAPVFPHLIDAIQKAHPALNIVTVYGSTEAEPIAHIAWEKVSSEDLSAMKRGAGLLVGKPVSATQVMIYLHENHSEKIGKIGQIAVSGDHVLKGYLNGIGDGETKLKLDQEIWHLTGDMGYLDKHARLWLVGRESAVFRHEGKQIYPIGIECAVMHHPAVVQCAVLEWNQVPTLCVELESENSDHLDLLKEDFPEYLCFKFLLLDSIPMDKRHNAKVDYPALKKMLSTQTH